MTEPSPTPLTVRSWIQNYATLDALALAAPGRSPLTYRRLSFLIDETVRQLNALGVGREDRVAVVLPNGPEMAAAFLGVASGATCAPLNPAYQAPEFEFYLSDLQPRALVIRAGMDSPARGVAQAHQIPVIELTPDPAAPAGVFALSGSPGPSPARRGFAEPEDTALVLHTSGTTSRPKIVPLTHANLCASAANIQASLDLGRDDRCLNVMPLFHIHGLVGAVLASLAGGGSVICTAGLDAARFFAWMDEFQPTWYTAVPTMHQAFLSRAAANRSILARRPLRFIRSCSAALPPQVMAELEKTFGAPVVEAYGMTEAAHQMATNPLPPRVRKPGSVGLASGVEIAIRDQAGQWAPAGQSGEIVIRGPGVTRGYENNPAANADSFVEGWFRTGDQGYLDHEGYLYLTGRLKEMINRGGEKISPREVDLVLMDHPAVAQVVTFAAPDRALGESVAAAVVRRDPSVTERELRRFVAARLAFFKVPRRIVFVEEIPKGPTGKLQRIGLAEKLGLTVEPEPDPTPAEFVAPRNAVEEWLAGLWCEVLHVSAVGVHQRFTDLGGTSVQAVQLVARVRQSLELDLSLLDFFDAATIAEQADLLGSRLESAEDGAQDQRPQS